MKRKSRRRKRGKDEFGQIKTHDMETLILGEATIRKKKEKSRDG